MNRFLPISVGSVGLLLCGCMVGPQYRRPAVTAPPAFKEAPPAQATATDGWKTGAPGDGDRKGDWWRMYQDPRLDQLEEQVDKANQTLKAAEANFRAAR